MPFKVFAFLQLLFLSIFASGCGEEVYEFDFPGKNVNVYDKKVELAFHHTLELEIDSLFSIDMIHSIVPFKDEDTSYIGILHGRDIYVYEAGESRHQRKITIAEEGPDAIKSIGTMDGLAIDSRSAFYLVTNTGGMSYALDESGHVTDKIMPPFENITSATYAYGFIRPKIIRDQLLIPAYGLGNTADFTKIPTRFIYNLNSKTFVPAFHYPDIYNKFFWGSNTLLRHSACDYNPIKKEYYVSYAIDPHVYIYNEKFSLKGKKILGSDYFSSLTPRDIDGNKRFDTTGQYAQGEQEYFMQLSYFFGGYYHPAQNYYLRLTRIGIDKEKDLGVRFSIIVADRNLQKVGEYIIPSHYQWNSFFLTDDGIAFLNMDKYDLSQETKIVFDVLQFVKTE